MKKVIIYFLLLIQLSFDANGQNFYFLSTEINHPINSTNVQFRVYDITNCEDNLISDVPFFFYTDITFDEVGDLFVFTPLTSSAGSTNRIHKIITLNPTFFVQVLEEIPDNVTALTCTPSGSIYAAGEGLTAWKTNGNVTNNYLGDFPPGMQAAGDLTYREGKLYMSSVSNSLIEVDVNNPSNSSVVFEFPPGTPEIHGLATVEIVCDSFVTYATGLTATGSIIYEIDFDNEILVEVCQTDRFIIGLASMDECLEPYCDVTVDLDQNDDSGVTGNNFEIGIVCSLPINITDDDIEINSELEHIDSIQIQIIGSNVNESLELLNSNNTITSGEGTPMLTIINNGSSTIQDFENAMLEVVYNNSSSSMSNTYITIEVVAYAYDAVSTPAYATIIVGESEVSINFEENGISCFGNGDGELIATPIGGVAPYSFLWSNNQTSNNITNLFSNNYQITVTDKYGCSETESILLSQPDSLIATINNIGASAVCNNVGQLLGVGSGGAGNYDFTWSNGITNNFNGGIGAGTYTVTLTDQNGCATIDSITIGEGMPVFTNELINLCAGDVYEFDNQILDTDTIVCEVISLVNGCDSTHCIELDFSEPIVTNFYENICPAGSFIWNGEILNQDTTVVDIYNSASGCDSIVTLQLGFHVLTPIEFNLEGSLCDGGQVLISTNGYNSYLWSTGENNSSITVGEEDVYSLFVTDEHNCEIFGEIEIMMEDLEIDFITSPPSCFGEKDGIIQIETIAGGTEPYLFSLGSQVMQPSFTFNNLASGVHSLLVEDVNGCTEVIEILIDEVLEPTLEIEDFHEIALGDSLELQLITNVIDPEVKWEPSLYLNCDTCLNVTSTPLNSVIYEIIITDINGCISKSSLEINIDKTLDVFVPNAFSPNDDRFNDVFTIYSGSSISKVNYLKIFDRWGNLVFDQINFLPNSIEMGWDGRFDHKIMLDGVYVYILEVERIDGSLHTLSGEITLIR